MLRLLLNECDDRRVGSVVIVGVLRKAAKNGREAPEALRMLLMELEETALTSADISSVVDTAEANPDLLSRDAALRILRDFLRWDAPSSSSLQGISGGASPTAREMFNERYFGGEETEVVGRGRSYH